MLTSTPSRSMSWTRACESTLTRAEAPVQRRPLADAVARHARPGRGAFDQRAERGQLRPVGHREELLDRLGRLDDMRVGVEDTVSREGHGCLLQGRAITSTSTDRTVACANAAPVAEPLSRRPRATPPDRE